MKSVKISFSRGQTATKKNPDMRFTPDCCDARPVAKCDPTASCGCYVRNKLSTDDDDVTEWSDVVMFRFQAKVHDALRHC